jgi:hypothetical protein
MLDSGVRIAAAFLPVGIPVLVGLVVAVLRRRSLPAVSDPAIAGLVLQLVALLAATFIVTEGSIHLFGLSPQALLTVSSILGFAVIVLQVLSWTLLLLALFRRLPAPDEDRKPTGRHALLDERGAQVIAEEGTVLLPVGAAAAGAGAGAGLGAAVATSTRAERPETSGPPLPPFPAVPGPEPEPAVTETFAVEPPVDHRADDGLDREEPPAVTAESLDEAAQTEDEAHGDVADIDAAERDETPDDEPGTTLVATGDVGPGAGPVEPDADLDADLEDRDAQPAAAPDADLEAAPDSDLEAAPDAELEAAPDSDLEAEPDAEPDAEPPVVDAAGSDTEVPATTDAEVDTDIEADPELAPTTDEDPADQDPADGATVTETLPAPGLSPDTAPGEHGPGSADRPATPAGGHPWFDPDGAATHGASEQAGATRAGSAEGR